MSYTGYTEGTFSAQINNFRNRVLFLEQQVATLSESLSMKEIEIKNLQTLLQKYIDVINTNNHEEQFVETTESVSAKNKTKKK